MPTVIYAIGGTGAKLLEALIHLCAAGVVQEDLDIRLVDQDQQNGNTQRSLKLLSDYCGARKAIGGEAGRPDGPPLFKAQIRYDPEVLRAVADQNDTLASAYRLTETALPADGADASELLMQVLFSAEERKARMVIGFRGLPAVGSAVFLSPAGQTQALWRRIRDDLDLARTGQVQQFLLLGSGFGGTGASGVPTIGGFLRSMLPRAGGPRVGAVLMLPYFRAVGEGESGPASPARMKAALEFYYKALMGGDGGQSNRLMDSVYLVGLASEIGIERKGAGGPDQANPALLPELIGAMGAAHFLHRGGMTRTAGHGTVPPAWQDDNPHLPVWVCGHKQASRIDWDDVPDPLTPGGFDGRPLLCSFARFALFFCYGLHPAERLSELKNTDDSPVYYRPLDIANVQSGAYDSQAQAVFVFAKQFIVWFGTLHATTQRPAFATQPPRLSLSEIAELVPADQPQGTPAPVISPEPYLLAQASGTEFARLDRVFASLNMGPRAAGSGHVLNKMARASVQGPRGMPNFVGLAYAAAALQP